MKCQNGFEGKDVLTAQSEFTAGTHDFGKNPEFLHF